MAKSFQIIGLRPLEGCNKKFRKNLQMDRLYLFDQRYKLEYDANREIVRINYDATKNIVPDNFYSDKLNIQINAIVGGNGSGKSAIAELLLYFLFYYGIQKKLISKDFYNDKSDEGTNVISNQANFRQELSWMKSKLNIELIYLFNKNIYRIILRSGKFNINIFKKKSGFYELDKELDLNDFKIPFYTMYINYSHYGLNTYTDGLWLGTLFHKNDGYKLPVVINPYRTKGNIDINIENYLSRDRVFTNVIETRDESIILPNHEIDYIEIKRDASKNTDIKQSTKERQIDIDLLVKPLYKRFFEEDYPESLSSYQMEVENYLLKKITTITERYNEYKDYNYLIAKPAKYKGVTETKFDELFNKIYEDRSHVTLKIRQSLNFLHLDFYQINFKNGTKNFKLKSIIESIEKLRKEDFFTQTIDYLPPPIFMTRFHFKDKSNFDKLSSGEKQQIYSIHSILYHLRNLNSVHFSNIKKQTYESVFFILDEIELYYHPQAQKKTIDRLLYILEKSKLKKVKNLNILFLTHSPFILSDIPAEHTLKLKEGKIYNNETKQKTFAANITDLLNDSFFLKDGLIGDFAKRKIKNVLDNLNYKILSSEIETIEKRDRTEEVDFLRSKKEERREMEGKFPVLDENKIRSLIDIVDEPLLKFKLNDMYCQAFPGTLDKEDAKTRAKKILYQAGLSWEDLNGNNL